MNQIQFEILSNDKFTAVAKEVVSLFAEHELSYAEALQVLEYVKSVMAGQQVQSSTD